MMRNLAALFVVLVASPLLAGEMKVHRDLAYAEPKSERRTLDVYSPAEGKLHPIVFWIHGGGWKAGDKSSAQKKAQPFVNQGYVFAATNYRFLPVVTVKEMAADIAKSIRYVHDHAKEFGGDPDSIIVMGHSSGAHIAALVCTDDRYLKAEGLSLAILKGCVPVDSSFYDIPKRVKDGGDTKPETIKEIFTDKEEYQRECSAATYVEKGKHIPAFLILHVAERQDTKTQAHWLAGKLKEVGVSAEIVAPKDKTHGSIGSELAVLDDETTQSLFTFLKKVQVKE